MEDSDINSTKNKLFQKAFEVASHNKGVPVPVVPMHQHQQFNNSGNPLGPPLSIDINTTDGALEGAGFKYRFRINLADNLILGVAMNLVILLLLLGFSLVKLLRMRHQWITELMQDMVIRIGELIGHTGTKEGMELI